LSTLFCPYRREHLTAQPEELIRQSLLKAMTEQLGYPTGAILVEKALSQLPHLSASGRSLPGRRVDILVYTNAGLKGLVPLLLIECKAVRLKQAALQQVAGYNHYIGAPFIAVANAEQIFMGWQDLVKGASRTIDFLPSYAQLLAYFHPKEAITPL